MVPAACSSSARASQARWLSPSTMIADFPPTRLQRSVSRTSSPSTLTIAPVLTRPFCVALHRPGHGSPASFSPAAQPTGSFVAWRLASSGRHGSIGSTPVPPNHALQRTEAGVRVFSVYHVLSREPLSLSLSPLGPGSLLSVGEWRAGSRSSAGERVPVPLPACPSFRYIGSSAHPLPAAAPILPPPESMSVLRSAAL